MSSMIGLALMVLIGTCWLSSIVADAWENCGKTDIAFGGPWEIEFRDLTRGEG